MKLIFISGYTADIIHTKGILEEDADFISKPFSKADLLRKVREVLDKKWKIKHICRQSPEIKKGWIIQPFSFSPLCRGLEDLTASSY